MPVAGDFHLLLTAMTHIAIQDAVIGKVVDWMKKVSDKQYGE